jgi:hypothetical protein
MTAPRQRLFKKDTKDLYVEEDWGSLTGCEAYLYLDGNLLLAGNPVRIVRASPYDADYGDPDMLDNYAGTPIPILRGDLKDARKGYQLKRV